MSLDKAVEHGKEKRKPYKYKSNYAKSVNYHCRNHGSCTYCQRNRIYNTRKRLIKTKFDMEEWKEQQMNLEDAKKVLDILIRNDHNFLGKDGVEALKTIKEELNRDIGDLEKWKNF